MAWWILITYFVWIICISLILVILESWFVYFWISPCIILVLRHNIHFIYDGIFIVVLLHVRWLFYCINECYLLLSSFEWYPMIWFLCFSLTILFKMFIMFYLGSNFFDFLLLMNQFNILIFIHQFFMLLCFSFYLINVGFLFDNFITIFWAKWRLLFRWDKMFRMCRY